MHFSSAGSGRGIRGQAPYFPVGFCTLPGVCPYCFLQLPLRRAREFCFSLKGLWLSMSALRSRAWKHLGLMVLTSPPPLNSETPSEAGSSKHQCLSIPDLSPHGTQQQSEESLASCEFVRGRWLVIPKELPDAESQYRNDFVSFTVAHDVDFLY